MSRAIFIIFILMSLVANSHSGRTDEQGGHYNRKTGTYHFHHGDDFEQYDNKSVAYQKSLIKQERKESNDRLFWNIVKYGAIGIGGLFIFNRIVKRKP